MKKWLLPCFTVLMLAFSLNSGAQSPCANLTVTPSQLPMIPCDTNNLTISFNANINLNFPINRTDSYSVNQVPYNPAPWVGAQQVLNGTDDLWSGAIGLPFPFCFYGNTFDSIVIGSNGRITFNTYMAGENDAWNTSSPATPAPHPEPTPIPPVPPSPFFIQAMNNTIMAPYHDTDPGLFAVPTGFPANPANITWDTFGVAPCRTMVINWDSIPMFSCNDSILSQQIVLYEFSNIIDINIRNKAVCATWNGGFAMEGIQNGDGTRALMVPGRNNTIWSTANDSWQFTPNGNPYPFTATYTWRDATTNAFLGTGSSINITTPFPSSIVCEAAISGGCTNQITYARDTTVFLPSKIDAGFISDVRLGCENDTVFFTNTTTPSNNVTYFWNFGDGNFDTQTDPMHIYGVQGVYNVRLVANHPVCIGDTLDTTLNLNHPITADFSVTPDSVCFGTPIVVSNNSLASLPIPMPNLFINTWDMGDGNTVVNNAQQFPYTYAQPGTYTIKLVITDTLGCLDSTTQVVFVEDSAFVSLAASPTEVCLGNYVQFTDQFATHTINTIYDFDDGTVLSNVHNPRHTYEQPGTYNITFTGQYLICPDKSESVSVQVNDYPLLNLGPDTSYCPGLTNPITLSNIENPSQILQWSDGTSGPTLEVDDFGKFWATATNLNCLSTDSVWVKRDCYLNIPNSFSPNADGRNDYFIPRQLLSQGLKEFSMKIYNRWGELIFETNSIDGRGWDGNYGNEPQATGVFVYVIDAQWNNNYRNSFTGNVTLLR